jgi:hypothetical protein
MWKVVVGFIAFAGLALFILSKGPEIDMGGEKHGVDVPSSIPVPVPVAAAGAAK